MPFVLALFIGCQAQNDPPRDATPESKETTTSIPAHVTRFIKHEVRDRQGTGLVAASYLVPHDWAVKDRLWWEYRDCFQPVRYSAKLTSSDGLMRIEVFPDIAASWSTNPYATQGLRPPAGVIAGLKQFVRSERSSRKLHFVSEKEIPESPPQTIQQGGGVTQISIVGGAVRVRYQESKKTVEEEFYATLTLVRVAAQGVIYQESITWSLTGLSACASFGGKLDDCRRMAHAIRSSYRIRLPFFNRYVQVQNMLQDQVYARIYQAGQLSRIISQTHAEISQSITDSYYERQKSNDRINEKFSDYIRGIDRYSDGGGTEYQFPSGYTNAWVNNRGEYLLTDQTGYNPNVELEGEWKPLEKK